MHSAKAYFNVSNPNNKVHKGQYVILHTNSCDDSKMVEFLTIYFLINIICFINCLIVELTSTFMATFCFVIDRRTRFICSATKCTFFFTVHLCCFHDVVCKIFLCTFLKSDFSTCQAFSRLGCCDPDKN